MGAPGYYLIDIGAYGEPDYDAEGDPVVSGSLVILPIQSRIGVEYGTERADILHETERGRRYVYPEFNRQVRRMTFRLTLTQLAAFQALDEAVGGQRDPFIWVVDTDESPATRLFVRKDAHFLVRQHPNVGHGELVDLQINLSEEPTGPGITD
jgi:hypothetical protein